MITFKRSIIVAAAIVVASLSWFQISRHWNQAKLTRDTADCQQRDALFNQRVESLKKDAQEGLKIGTEKAGVSRFFTEHGFQLDITRFGAKGPLHAVGTLYTTGGCAPLGCGTNRVVIQLRVKIGADGAVASEPVVIVGYEDCV